jgi:translin
MLPSNIQKSLDQINEDLKNVEERREILIKGSRDVVMFCSKSIVALHRNEIEEAQNKMNQAKIMLDESRQYAKTDLNRYIIVAEQELVEAYTLKSVVQDSPLPDLNELNVSGSSYITGLLDCIGEIKRMVYDRMRLGRAEDAARLFTTMQEIYGAVYPFAVYDNLVSGIRRKLDVAKMLIEDIRAVVTEEARRSIMIKAMDSLERKL